MMNHLQPRLFKILVTLVAISAAACSASSLANHSIVSSPGEIMRSNSVSQTSITSSQSRSTAQTTTQTTTQTTAQTTVNLRAANLQQPHYLIIRSSGQTLTGQITLDGTVIQVLRSNPTEIDLSPYLSAGQHQVEISGSSAPATANITIEFVAPGTRVTQQHSGNGILRQQLNLLVQ